MDCIGSSPTGCYSLVHCTTDVLLHDSLTNEFVCFVQPGQQFLTVVVINWDAHEVALTDKVWLWTGVTGIQHIGDTILSHQILQRER